MKTRQDQTEMSERFVEINGSRNCRAVAAKPRPIPEFLSVTLQTILTHGTVWRLRRCRGLIMAVLLLTTIGERVASSTARAQTLQGPILNVLSPSEPQEAEITRACSQDRCLQSADELEHAIFERLELRYPDRCLGPDGRTLSIRIEETTLRGDGVTVSYVLVLFESCEEGALYLAFPRKEKWLYKAKHWQFVEDLSPIAKLQ